MKVLRRNPGSSHPRPHSPSSWLGYSISCALIAGCAWGRMAFVQGPNPIAPFLLFYPAIAGAAFLGGSGPGFLVMAGAAAFGAFLFPVFPSPASWIALGTFGPAFALGFARIRDQRHRSEAVAMESARLRFVMEKVSDWIFLVDDNGRIEYANQTACDRLGYSREELTGRAIAEFDADPGNPLLPGCVAQCGEGPVSSAEILFLARDGAKIAAEVSCTSIQVGTDHVTHVAARDISERRHLDQKLREARQWESLGALTGGLAHDFNNLLTAIMGNASLARELIASDSEAVGLLLSVEHAGERCAELIRMMLAASGYRPRHAQRLHLDRLASDAVASRPLPAGVTVLIDAPPCEFESDRASVETLLAGLISNAAESYGAAPGEVRVSVMQSNAPRLAPGSFQEGEVREGLYVGIVVEDRGCGMAPETVERAFNPFFSTKFTGRGLGLPAVRGIVRAHSGILWMRTAPGEGTRVEVWLPAAGYHLSEPTSARV